MTAPALLLLSVAIVCSKAGTTGLAADYGRHNTTIDENNTTQWTNSISNRINFVTSPMMSKYSSNLRKFNLTTLSGDRHKRVKREEDRCAAFKYIYNQDLIYHPHSLDKLTGSNYYRNVNCVTVINGTEGSVIELTFVDLFRVEDHPHCAYDFLEIRDGARGYAPLLGGKKLCGMRFPPPIVTTGPFAWLKFHSDDTIEHEGFHIKIAMKQAPKSYVVPDSCHIQVSGVDGILDIGSIDKKCKDTSENLDVLWTITVEENYKIYLNFSKFELSEPYDCKENVVQVFNSIIEFDAKLAHYCGSIATALTSIVDDDKIPKDDGNVLNIRLYASKAVKDDTNVIIHYNRFRILDPADETDVCSDNEFNCQDSTCISNELRCDGYANCRLKADEDIDLCKGETQTMISESRIFIVFCLILSAMVFVCLFKCFRKIYKDHKIIREHIRQSLEDGLDSLAEKQLTLDPKMLERDSEPRASLKRENQKNKEKQKSLSKHQLSSIDSYFLHLDLENEPWRREVDRVPNAADNMTLEPNGRTRKADTSKKEESKRRKREIAERREKEMIDVSVGASDMKESGCQTRESLFQTDPLPSSDGKASRSRRLSTFSKSAAAIARPSSPPQTTTSEVTIVLNQASMDSVKIQKKTPDRRPMSTVTTRSAPDVIIVSKPI